MEEPHLTAQSENKAPLGFVEFVTLVAAMMALTALGIDSMLPRCRRSARAWVSIRPTTANM
jgi:hypothetical protein